MIVLIIVIALVVLWAYHVYRTDSTWAAQHADPRTDRLYLGTVDQVMTSFELDPKEKGKFGSTFVNGFVELDGVVTFAAMEGLVRDYLVVHDRFRRRLVVSRWFRSFYTLDDKFALSNHLFRHAEHTTHAAFQEFVSHRFSQPMPIDHPLWEFHVFESYGDGGGGRRSLVYMRYHHNLADGVSMLTVGMGMLRTPKGSAPPQRPPPPALSSMIPRAPRRSMWRSCVMVLKAVGGLLLRTMDPASPVKLRTWMTVESPRVAMVLEQPLQVSRIKRIAKAIGSNYTVNDVLLSITSGVLAQIGREAGAASSSSSSSALPNGDVTLWVNLRGATNLYALAESDDVPEVVWGNAIGMFYVKGQWDTADPIKRVRLVHEQMRRLKQTPNAVVSHYVMATFGALWPWLSRLIFGMVGHYSTASMSNLRGPDFELTMAGRTVRQFGFFACPIYTIGHFVGYLSYMDTLSMTYTIDGRILAATDRSKSLDDRVSEELHKLEFSLFYS